MSPSIAAPMSYTKCLVAQAYGSGHNVIQRWPRLVTRHSLPKQQRYGELWRTPRRSTARYGLPAHDQQMLAGTIPSQYTPLPYGIPWLVRNYVIRRASYFHLNPICTRPSLFLFSPRLALSHTRASAKWVARTIHLPLCASNALGRCLTITRRLLTPENFQAAQPSSMLSLFLVPELSSSSILENIALLFLSH